MDYGYLHMRDYRPINEIIAVKIDGRCYCISNKYYNRQTGQQIVDHIGAGVFQAGQDITGWIEHMNLAPGVQEGAERYYKYNIQIIELDEPKGGPMDEFTRLLLDLDMKLTGKEHEAAHVENQHRFSQIQTPDDFIFKAGDGCKYLSDGGYSRLGFNWERGLFLTSVSREEVFAQWESCADLVNQLNQIIWNRLNELRAKEEGAK